jgi:hypothetical protein
MLAVKLRRQRAVGNEVVEHSVKERGILGVVAQVSSPIPESAASSAAVAIRHVRGVGSQATHVKMRG